VARLAVTEGLLRKEKLKSRSERLQITARILKSILAVGGGTACRDGGIVTQRKTKKPF